MNKKARRHLARRGIYRTRLPEEDTFTARAPEFFRWFHEEVMGFDSEEYRRSFWREASEHGHTIGHMPYGLREYMRRRVVGAYHVGIANALEYCLWMGGSFAIWFIRRAIDRHLGRLRRPAYYEAERERRLMLAKERRRIRRRSTLNKCPSVEELRKAFAHRGESPESALRLGSLLEDLECHVDNSPLVVGGRVVGRRAGVKGWLHDNAQDLFAHYKCLMHFKALSKRFRQAVDVSDPVPAIVVLPPIAEPATDSVVQPAADDLRDFTSDEDSDSHRERMATLQEFSSDEGSGGTSGGKSALREFNSDWNRLATRRHLESAKGRAEALLAAVREDGGSTLALEAQLERMLNPEYSPVRPSIMDSSTNSNLGMNVNNGMDARNARTSMNESTGMNASSSMDTNIGMNANTDMNASSPMNTKPGMDANVGKLRVEMANLHGMPAVHAPHGKVHEDDSGHLRHGEDCMCGMAG